MRIPPFAGSFRRALPPAAFLFLAGARLLAEPSWEPAVFPEDQIFPSHIICTASAPDDMSDEWVMPILGDPTGLIGAQLSEARKGDVVKVVVKKNGLMDESAFEGTVRKNAGEVAVLPKIKYRYDKLAKVRQTQPLNVSIETWLNGESLGEQTKTVTVHPINDCLFGVGDDDGNVVYQSDFDYAAYVNESHPWVDEVLRAALKTGVVDAFDGYQGDTEDVLMQMFAIWKVLNARGMKYSSITTTAVESDHVYSQHVRLFDESVKARQANCVDGSVLLAAVFRKIGLDVSLVTVPGHMYLAVNLEEGNDDSMIGLETTMMGDHDADADEGLEAISKETREEWGEDEAFRGFEAAVNVGTKDLEEHADDFADEDNLDCLLINLTEARKDGVLPIAFAGDGGAAGFDEDDDADGDADDDSDDEEDSDAEDSGDE